MLEIIFEVHATSIDNEAQLASGHSDTDLSATGIKQAEQMRERYQNSGLAAVVTSDLKRASRTALIAFRRTDTAVIEDVRLRECDYGDYTKKPSKQVKAIKTKYISEPFPNGQSYEQTTKNVNELLKELKIKYDGKKILIIGHAATHYALEHLLKGVSLKEAIQAPWSWQPGWRYELR